MRRGLGRVRRGAGVALAVFLAGMLPWWVIWLIEPRPNRVLFGIAEYLLGLREMSLELAAAIVWVNGAIFATELAGPYLLAYFWSRGRLRTGWLWGVAVGTTSILLSLSEPAFRTMMPKMPGRVIYWPDASSIVYLFRDVMLTFHLLAVTFLPHLGGLLGAWAAGRRRETAGATGGR